MQFGARLKKIPPDPSQLELEYLEHEKAILALAALSQQVQPEQINETPENAPSKRILAAIPEYNKATVGPATASAIGLATLRRRCPHFAAWFAGLEALAPH
jgi:hypothetical protein